MDGGNEEAALSIKLRVQRRGSFLSFGHFLLVYDCLRRSTAVQLRFDAADRLSAAIFGIKKERCHTGRSTQATDRFQQGIGNTAQQPDWGLDQCA